MITGPLTIGDHTRSLEVDKRPRTYLVHVPPNYDPKKPAPVVLVFHGGGSNAEQMVTFCGLNETADQHGFVVVYPNGTGRLGNLLTFNGGNCCGSAMTNNVDDVAFTKALLDDLARVVKVDPKRVYVTGMSKNPRGRFFLIDTHPISRDNTPLTCLASCVGFLAHESPQLSSLISPGVK
jgi:polyhydroxybutyrate depolymerase